jgi:hypothetical protein
VDESEKLIALVALGTPNQAVKAWNLWNKKNSKKEASSILSWSGGYMYHNLGKAGYEDKYLHGIYLHNQILNNLKLSMASPILKEINKKYGIIPIKSFGMSNRDFSWGFRPVADFDFYMSDSFLEELWEFMETNNLLPLMSISKIEFLTKIVKQRGSWNFIKKEKYDIDVHWRLFDHLTIKQNSELVKSQTENIKTSNNIDCHLTRNLEIVLLAKHFFHQGENRFNGLFDFYHVAKKVEPEKVMNLIKSTDTRDVFLTTLVAINEILGENIDLKLAWMHKNLQRSTTKKNDAIKQKKRYFTSIHPDDFELYSHRHLYLYKLWNFLGRHSLFERFCIKIFGPFNVQIFSENKLIDMKSIENMSIGWHYVYPTQSYRWAHSPDSRLTFHARRGKSYELTISLDTYAWSIAPIGAFDLFLNGVYIQTYDKKFDVYHLKYKAKSKFLEISLRPTIILDYRGTNDFNWHRMSIPVKQVSFIEISENRHNLE